MSRSQGAATGGWPAQRQPAGEPDPRSGGRPAARQQAAAPQAQQQHAPQYPAYAQPPHPGYAEPQTAPPAYHYPQNPQVPQYAPPPAAPNRGGNGAEGPQHARAGHAGRGLSSLDSARNAPPTHDFDSIPRTQPPYAGQPQRPLQQQPVGGPPPRGAHHPQPPAEQHAGARPGYRQAQSAPLPPGVPQYAPRVPQQQAAPDLRAPVYDQWPQRQAGPQDALGDHGPHGYDLGAYLPADAGYPGNSNGYADAAQHGDPLQQGEWAMPAAGFGDPNIEQQAYRGNQFGYDQAHGGALEASYNQDEAAEYEPEEPRRGSWAMRIAGGVVVAIGLGYGLAQAYKVVLGPPPDGTPPVIESNATPARERPSDPGGRQFSHTDSKVLGRLNEDDNAHGEYGSGGLSESDANDGSRKVTTLVVGRDGSIAPPPPAEQASHEETVSVPGLMVVDAFGGGQPMPLGHSAPPEPASDPVVVNQPQRSGVNVKSTKVIPAATASLPDETPAPAAKKERVAAAAPAAAAATPAAPAATGANGYVVVLASVPASSTSRLDALRKFADMQQQYGMVLGNKTPDVRETNLAGKGPYHRLLVGPPGSRSQANDLCTQLKASGYSDCWVTAY